MNDEKQRDKDQQFLDERAAFPFTSLRDDTRQELLPKLEQLEHLTRTIDSKRQKLISLELLMLDNSIKDLQTTTNQVLTSSNRLENFTRLLIYLTVSLGIIAILSTAVVILQINAYVGFIGVAASLVAMVYLWIKAIPNIRQMHLRRNGKA